MSGFRTAVKVIENHLTEYSTTEFKAANTPWPLNHTYALVCGDNQTYYVGFTKAPWDIQKKFQLWRDTGKTSKLPKKFREFMTQTSKTPRLFIVEDDWKATYKRVNRHLEEELTQYR